jgi:hypothetical protein
MKLRCWKNYHNFFIGGYDLNTFTAEWKYHEKFNISKTKKIIDFFEILIIQFVHGEADLRLW